MNSLKQANYAQNASDMRFSAAKEVFAGKFGLIWPQQTQTLSGAMIPVTAIHSVMRVNP